MSFWVNFESPELREEVYLTNGAHRDICHGVSMTYDRGHMKVTYRKPDGMEWQTETSDILPGYWYHVTTTWKNDQGLSLYIDGRRKQLDGSATRKYVALPVSGQSFRPPFT